MGWYVTIILAGGGLFCVFCAWRDYDWFFNNYASRPFVAIFGRKWARIFYIALGVFIMVPGVLRIAHPPVKFTEEHGRYFTEPFGFPLLDAGSVARLRATPGVGDFRESGGNWQDFALVLDPERFPMLKEPSSLFVDVDGGFVLNERKFAGRKCTGVLLYFDSAYRHCDNFLFSSTPLSSAEFIVLIWDTATSREFGRTDGLLATFHRRGSPTFTHFQKL